MTRQLQPLFDIPGDETPPWISWRPRPRTAGPVHQPGVQQTHGSDHLWRAWSQDAHESNNLSTLNSTQFGLVIQFSLPVLSTHNIVFCCIMTSELTWNHMSQPPTTSSIICSILMMINFKKINKSVTLMGQS